MSGGRRTVLTLAIPVVLAQMATAAPGLVDTAVMGATGSGGGLAAVGIGSATLAFLFWGLGFLRMSTTGLTALATGADDREEVRAVLQRALLLAVALGVLLWGLIPCVAGTVLLWFQAEPAVVELARDYLIGRTVGAPAALAGFAVTGWLLGKGWTGRLLGFNLVLNGANVAFTIGFVLGLDLGPFGVGLGTSVADWLALGAGLWWVAPGLRGGARLWRPDRLRAMLAANRDITIRTLFLLVGMAWFVRSGTRIGTDTAAGNEVLLQFIVVSAFVLDAFAFVAERQVGEAVGARDPARFRAAVRHTSEFALGAGMLFALGIWTVGDEVVERFVRDPNARQVALDHLAYVAWVPVLGVPAWQLDGILLGATRGRALRNAAIASTVTYLLLDIGLRPWENAGTWLAFLGFYVVRAVFLAPAVPRLHRAVTR